MAMNYFIRHWKRYLSPPFLIAKLQEKGMVGFIRMGAGKGYRYFTRPASWADLALRKKLRPVAPYEKRILAVWDFRTQPYAIGNMLWFHVATQILCLTHKVGKVDICVLCEPDKAKSADPSIKEINPHNYDYYLTSLLPVVFVNSMLGSLLLFDVRGHLEEFVAKNIAHYHVWPSFRVYGTEEFLGRRIERMVLEFYRKFRSVPYLSCRPVTVDWARWFIGDKVLPAVPIVVALRNNPIHKPHRNSNIDAWIEFFDYCQAQFPVKFVVVCAVDEIDTRLHSLPNVVVAKDFHTTVEQDLALIQASAAFMGGPSGPLVMAVFNKKPYVIVNFQKNEDVSLVDRPNISKYIFAQEHQRLVVRPDTASVLIEEFSRLFSKIDVSRWKGAKKVTNPLAPERMMRLR